MVDDQITVSLTVPYQQRNYIFHINFAIDICDMCIIDNMV